MANKEEVYSTTWQTINTEGRASVFGITLSRGDTARLVAKIVTHRHLEAFNVNVHKLVDVTDEFLPDKENRTAER